MFRLQIDDQYFISDIEVGDKSAYIEHLQERQIYEQTLAIPFPYTEANADWWINFNLEATKAQGGRSTNWAIRRADGYLIGGIGFIDLKIGKSFKSELGYWLAKPYWGKGIMTRAVQKVLEVGFGEFGLARITASVFEFNIGSARVLEKTGFQLEGHLRSHYQKDGKLFDGRIYAKLAKETVDYSGRPDCIKHWSEVLSPDNSHYPESQELHSIGAPLGKSTGLKNIGVHHEILKPGRRTSWPHAESAEEEFVYVVQGYPSAWINGRLYPLRPGDGVGFPAGTGVAHTFINNSKIDAVLLVVGERKPGVNKFIYPLHPDQNAKSGESLWRDWPPQEMGNHDGRPD